MSDDQIAGFVARAAWLRRATAVYFAIAFPWTAAAHVRVAAEWARPAGVLAGLAAAWWFGLPVPTPHPIVVGLPRGHSRKAPRSVTVLQRDLGGDVTSYRGLPTVSRALAVLDAAVALGHAGQPFLDRVLQQGSVNLEDLRRTQNRHLGRRGSGVAARLIARAGDRAASEAERRFLALLRSGGVTGWSVNHTVELLDGRRAVIDVAFADLRFAIEVDGWAFHVDLERFVDGRARKRALTAAGWVCIEVTWDDLEQRPAQVLDDIRRTLLRLSSRP